MLPARAIVSRQPRSEIAGNPCASWIRSHWVFTLVGAAKIKSERLRKQKTDRPDAQLLLKPLRKDNFPRVLGIQSGKS